MRPTRPAYTLLEVLLALAISVMLLAAVYAVVGYQLRYAQSGRDLVERTALARAILRRVTTDISAAVTLGDAGRFRRTQSQQGTQQGSGGDSSGGGSGGAPAAGATVSGDSGAASSSGVQLPLGVIGSSTELHLFLSRVPVEALADDAQVTCDLRRVSYWLSDDTQGLCRMEVNLVTSDDATNTDLPGDAGPYHFAPEVRQLEFSYFDGSSWQDSWDSTQTGSDGVTPQGSPRAIAVKITVQVPGHKELKTYRHVVHVLTAGGTPQSSSEGGTTP